MILQSIFVLFSVVSSLLNGINFYGVNEKHSDKDTCIREKTSYHRNLILDIAIR